MFVGATNATGDAQLWQVRQATGAVDDSGAFGEQVERLFGDYAEASEVTKTRIRDLEHHQAMTQPTWQNGVYAIHHDSLVADRDATLKSFTTAVSSLLDDYGIDRTVTVSLVQDPNGQIRVMNGHPQAGKIEELLNGSFVLQNSMAKVMSLSYQIWMDEQIASGKVDASAAVSAMRDLSFDLGGAGDLSEGMVRLFGDLLSSSVQRQVENQADYAVKKYEEFLEQVEKQHRLDEEHRDRIQKEKLAQEAADKRYEQIHPDQKPRPVFI
jgi:hypothetical protein